LRQLTDVCRAIAAGEIDAALSRLGSLAVAPESLGPAEPARLRSVALTRSGDHAAAHAADRLAFRLATARVEAIRDGYLANLAARLDAGEGRRGPVRQRGDALADPLTGLPNRRYLERYVTTLLARGERAAIGVCDLTGLAEVVARHGRRTGDLVLQRFAAALDRVMRRGDVVARYADDEFVVALPGAGPPQAADVTRRIHAAVAGEEWSTLAPGIAVGVAVGWADVSVTGRGLAAALAAASATRTDPAQSAPTAPGGVTERASPG
jgi:diguanylate cyclase (GGDEF)-like protein